MNKPIRLLNLFCEHVGPNVQTLEHWPELNGQEDERGYLFCICGGRALIQPYAEFIWVRDETGALVLEKREVNVIEGPASHVRIEPKPVVRPKLSLKI